MIYNKDKEYTLKYVTSEGEQKELQLLKEAKKQQIKKEF